MFSKFLFLVGSANAAANVAWDSPYNLNPFVKNTADTAAGWIETFKLNNGGVAHDILKSDSSNASGYGCAQCIGAGWEWIPKNAGAWWHQYEPAGAALTQAEKQVTAMRGFCCTPKQSDAGANVYQQSDHGTANNRGCGGDGAIDSGAFTNANTKAATWGSHAKFKSPDVAIMACPTNKKAGQECGGKTTIDFDVANAAQSQEILISGTMKAWHSCTFILKSKCKAPTFSVIADAAKTKGDGNLLVKNIFKVRYLEYAAPAIQASKDYIAETTQFSKMSDIVSEPEKYLGGDMFELKQASVLPMGYTVANWSGTQMVPGNLVATWVQEKKAEYTAWQNLWKDGSAYDNAWQLWNYVHQIEGWKKASWTTDGTAGTAAKPKWVEDTQKTKFDGLMPVIQKWDATAKKMVANADTPPKKSKLQVEKPQVPPMPAAYNGPELKASNSAADKLEVVSGFGKSVSGRYHPTLTNAAGNGETFSGAKSFGVRGQGNLKPDPNSSAAGATIAGSDHLWSMIEPKQTTTAANCVMHYVMISVQGDDTQANTNKLGLTVKASEWDTRSLAAPAAPAAIPAGKLPLDRGAKYLAATGAAILSLAAALY